MMTDHTQNYQKWINRLAPLLIAAIVFAVFSRSLNGGFLDWDDTINFLDNTEYRGFSLPHLKWMFTTYGLGPYSPLMWLSACLDYMVWGMDPFGWHLTNLLIHCANSVLLYFLCLRLLAIRHQAPEDRPKLSLASALGALLFALHPLCVETVSWASTRPNLLLTLFYQLAILSYITARASGAGGASWWRRQALPLLLFLLALLSKGTAVTLPLVLLLLDVYPLGRLNGGPRRWLAQDSRKVLIEKLPYFALSLAFGVVAFMGQTEVGSIVSYEKFGLSQRAAQMLYGLAFYPLKTLIPLGLIPAYWLPDSFGVFNWQSLLRAAGVATATAMAVVLRRRLPALTAAWAYYLLTIWPVLGLVKVNYYWAADRYAYLACLGFAVLAAAGVLSAARSAGIMRRRLTLGAACVILTALSWLTWRQQSIWLSEEALWRYTLSVDSDSWVAHNNLGAITRDSGSTEEAMFHCSEALRLKPDLAQAHNSMGALLKDLGRYDRAEAAYRKAIKLWPDYREAHHNLGILLLSRNQAPEAAAEFRTALNIDQLQASVVINLGVALAAQGKPSEAREQFIRAISLEPDNAMAYCNLANALRDEGKRAEAIKVFRRALALEPGMQRARLGLALALAESGMLAEANSELSIMGPIQPDNRLYGTIDKYSLPAPRPR